MENEQDLGAEALRAELAAALQREKDLRQELEAVRERAPEQSQIAEQLEEEARRLEELRTVLDAREAEIEARWARLEADFELRDVKLEQRDEDVSPPAHGPVRKDSIVWQYAGQLESEMTRREAEWWDKQLGKRPSSVTR